MKKKLARTQVPLASSGAKPISYGSWLLLGLLVAVYVVGFYYDVRLRDDFSWMDPDLYYKFAASLIGAFHGINQFNVPTIFPFFIVPFLLIGGVSIASALWVNIFFLIVLCLAVRRLCQQLEITVSSSLVIAAILSSPLLIGLSRELYIEFALTAITALVFSLWFDSHRQASRWRTVLFGAAFGLGFMMKTTFPLFFVGPFIVVAVSLVKARQYGQLFRELAAFCVPAVIVVALTYLVFQQSFEYYLNAANTTIPIMKLIGPGTVFSAPSLFYYISNIWKTMLFLLTPLLVLALVWRQSRSALTDRKAAVLWAWLAGPLLLLTLVETKEPRHVAPCVVPAVLLLFRGISAIRPAGARNAMSVVVLAVSITQYLLVTHHVVEAPYFLDRASRTSEILEVMKEADPKWKQFGKQFRGGNDYFIEFCWKRTKNIVLQGFEPNMALSLTWYFQPAVVFDLDLLKEDSRQFNDVAYSRFEDIYFFNAFSIYNRRCLCRNYYRTLDADTVLDNADYILVCLGTGDADGVQIPGFRSAGVVGTGATRVQVLVANTSSARSYRTIYAREFLRSGKTLAPPDVAAIYFDLAIDASLREDIHELNRLFTEFPLERALEDDFPVDMRNIYFTKDGIRLRKIMVSALRSYAAQQPKTEPSPK